MPKRSPQKPPRRVQRSLSSASNDHPGREQLRQQDGRRRAPRVQHVHRHSGPAEGRKRPGDFVAAVRPVRLERGDARRTEGALDRRRAEGHAFIHLAGKAPLCRKVHEHRGAGRLQLCDPLRAPAFPCRAWRGISHGGCRRRCCRGLRGGRRWRAPRGNSGKRRPAEHKQRGQARGDEAGARASVQASPSTIYPHAKAGQEKRGEERA